MRPFLQVLSYAVFTAAFAFALYALAITATLWIAVVIGFLSALCAALYMATRDLPEGPAGLHRGE
jgi:uncharacterized membrane protein